MAKRKTRKDNTEAPPILNGSAGVDKFHYLADKLMANEHPIKVTLVGAGATGSAFAHHLARLQLILEKMNIFLQVTVVDYGTVRDSNIGKQQFSPAAKDMNKAAALTMQINRFYGLLWDASGSDISEISGNSKASDSGDIVIGAVDTVKARKGINKHFKHYWLDMGNMLHHGQVILGNGKDLPTVLQKYPKMKDDPAVPSCSVFDSLSKQSLYINDVAATYGAILLSDLLIKKKINYCGYFFNINNCMTTKLKIK